MVVERQVRRILQGSHMASDGGGHEPSGHLEGARQRDVGSRCDASCRGGKGEMVPGVRGELLQGGFTGRLSLIHLYLYL